MGTVQKEAKKGLTYMLLGCCIILIIINLCGKRKSNTTNKINNDTIVQLIRSRDSIHKVIDTSRVKIITIHEQCKTIVNTITKQSVDSDLVFFTNYTKKYRRSNN